jgi:hypothetical protein
MEENKMIENKQLEMYKIVKFRKSGTQKIMEINLTLDEAKRYCSRADTRGKNWFCGFTKQYMKEV